MVCSPYWSLVFFLTLGTAITLTAEDLIPSPGHTTYLVDPVAGDDTATAGKPWKSFAPVNRRRLAPGDQVVISPGVETASLMPSGGGTAKEPVVIRFQSGVHIFAPEQAQRETIYASNSTDAAQDMPIAILIRGMHHVRLVGDSTRPLLLAGGRMVQVFNDHAEDITYTNLTFDLLRPTVSEFHVAEATGASAVIIMAERSTYVIRDRRLEWTGDWGPGSDVQEAIPSEGTCWRRAGLRGWKGSGQVEATATDLGNRRVRLEFNDGVSGLTAGHQYHLTSRHRDRVGVHTARSSRITFRDCTVHALMGMGFVSQGTDTLTMERVDVRPPEGKGRTMAAWADIFQFSSCKGQITVDGCHLSGMGDDAINCHGTHLRIIEATGPQQVLMRFMHNQTYGFAAFAPGDEVAVVNAGSLREYAGNPHRRVTAVEQKSLKDWVVTLDGPVPTWQKDDVLDNLTWYPDLTATNNTISMDPVRGFLITTRGKVLVEGNTFYRCQMAGILVEDDAESWFESGPIRDLTISNNRFVGCGVGVQISPHARVRKAGEAIHENITISGNSFEHCGIVAQSVDGLRITRNTSVPGPLSVKINHNCTGVVMEGNSP